MIAQHVSCSKLPTSFALGAAAPPGGGNGGGRADSLAFLTLMAGAGSAGQDGEADAGEPDHRLVSRGPGPELDGKTGRTERNLAATGKILPVRLPDLAVPARSPVNPIGRMVKSEMALDGESPQGTEEPEESGAGIEGASPVVAVPALAPMVLQGAMASQEPASAQAGAAAATQDRAAKQENTRAAVEAEPAKGAVPEATVARFVPASPVPGKAALRMVSISTALAPSAEQANTPDTSTSPRDGQSTPAAMPNGLPFAAKPGRVSREIPARPDAAGEQRVIPEVTSKSADKLGGDPVVAGQSPASHAHTASGPLQAPGATERPAEIAQPASGERPTFESQIARELSRIVDSLSVAREAAAAKTATLALDHAEFGEMSLRFDQRRDGQLAVQLAAADADSHRAVAAAVADRPGFAQADHGSQQQAQSGSNGAARGGVADRDGQNPGNNSPRHERNEQQRGNGRAHDAGRGNGGRSGIFA